MHRRLISLAKSIPAPLIITIAASFLGGILTIGQAWTLSRVINGVFLDQLLLGDVWPALRSLLFIIAGRAFLSWVSDFTASTVAIRVKTDLRERLFAHLFKLGPAYARGERTGELSSTVVEGVEALDAYYSQYLPQLVVSALVPLSILFFVFPIDVLSGVVLLLTAPLIPFFMVLIGKVAESLTKRQYETLSRLSAHFLDSLQGLTTLKYFGASKSHVKTIARVSDNFRDTTLGVLRVTFLSAFVLELIATISTAIVAVEIGLRVLYGQMPFQPALFVLILAPEFYLPFRMLGLRFHAGMAGTSAAKRIYTILDLPLPIGSESAQPMPATAPASIVFESVTFTYPGETQPALKDIRLHLRAGQRVALVGASGAGKSTLASLLLRFAEPDKGCINIDGLNLNSLSADSWREHIAWVPQKPYLFHDTIAANIRIADPHATHEQVAAAADAANLRNFIESLPDQYETIVGEAGARLSSGQAQRLALARAFLKDAPILILDEPTSSLDPEQEALLEEAVSRLMAGRTVLTIAHRLNTVFSADQIIVLEAGRVVENGTHAELLRQAGVYSRMVSQVGGGGTGIHHKEQSLPAFAPAARPLEHTDMAMEIPSSISRRPVFFRLLEFLHGSWLRVAASVLLGALTILAGVGLMGTSAYLISAAALQPSIAALQVAIVGVRFFGLSRGVLRYLERLASHEVTFHLLARLRVWFYSALEPLAPARLMQYRAGDLLSRVVADVDSLENFYVRVVAPPLVAIIIAVSTSVLLGSFHPSLGWALSGALLILGAGVPFLSQFGGRKPGREMVARRAELHTQLVDGVQGMPDLIVFGRQGDRREAISTTGVGYARAQRSMSVVTGFNSGLSVLLTNLGMWFIVFLAIPLISDQQIEGVYLASLALITIAAFEAVTPLPQAAQMLGVSNAAARRLFEVVDTEPKVMEPSVPRPAPVAGMVQFNKLTFRYSPVDSNVLSDISFSLKKDKHVAVVGPSGAGKSTLINLLMRFWESSEGIQIDGYPINNYKSEDVRKLMAVVSQNAYFFNATLKQNLLLANPRAKMDEIEAACRQAQIHDFIAGLPQGYETWIGEQGARLSGGERQRLAIARALLKEAPIFLLDEPTANLDPLTEKAVLGTLWEVMERRTTLMITHRLVGLDRFDEILVLDRGTIIEKGTHSSLLDQGGLYRRMWDIQNRIFLADA
jgi:ATP-binding cassette, subfamily C, bacterial CydCD